MEGMEIMELKEVCHFLDNELRIKDIKDTSLNGLQVKGSPEIEKIGFAVDASLEVFNKAKNSGCNLIIVHHGLFWEHPECLLPTILYKRLKILIENRISLYAVHLPLDCNPLFGNNISLINLFNPCCIEPFGTYNGIKIGFKAKLKKGLKGEEIVKILDLSLNTSSKILPFGKEVIKTIAVISGGGCDCVKEAIEEEIDLFITGEAKLFSFSLASEAHLNIIFSGHYATEVLGLKALLKHIEQKFSIECLFIDLPCWI